MTKVVDTEGGLHNWRPTSNPRGRASQYHLQLRVLLSEMFPNEIVLEEVSVPGERLFLDFYVPTRKAVIEVHGEQHYTFNPHFFSNRKDFVKAQQNDKRKQYWCELNNFIYIELPYNETVNDWKDKLSKLK